MTHAIAEGTQRTASAFSATATPATGPAPAAGGLPGDDAALLQGAEPGAKVLS